MLLSGHGAKAAAVARLARVAGRRGVSEFVEPRPRRERGEEQLGGLKGRPAGHGGSVGGGRAERVTWRCGRRSRGARA